MHRIVYKKKMWLSLSQSMARCNWPQAKPEPYQTHYSIDIVSFVRWIRFGEMKLIYGWSKVSTKKNVCGTWLWRHRWVTQYVSHTWMLWSFLIADHIQHSVVLNMGSERKKRTKQQQQQQKNNRKNNKQSSVTKNSHLREQHFREQPVRHFHAIGRPFPAYSSRG